MTKVCYYIPHTMALETKAVGKVFLNAKEYRKTDKWKRIAKEANNLGKFFSGINRTFC